MRLVLGVGVALAGSLALAAANAPPPVASPAYNPASAVRGKALAVPCMECHAVDDMMAGDPPFHVPRLGGQRPEAIFMALQEYKSAARKSDVMAPMVEPLTVQNMRDLGAYLAGAGPQMPGSHDQGSWAHQKVRRDCTACHGESGMGVMTGVPVLTGQHADYLVHALKAYKAGQRTDPTMGPIAAKLSDKEIGLLATYFAKTTHLKVVK